MIKLARVYHTDDLVNHEKLSYVDYINDPHISNVDISLPTLIVGWSIVKKLVENDTNMDASILDETIISNNLYWTYSFKENKHGHISGVEKFINNIPQYFFSGKFSYINLDPVFFSIESIDELMNLLPKTDVSDLLTLKRVYVYIYKNDMIYILCDDKISGIDLRAYEFFNFDIEKIKSELISRSHKYFNDVDGAKYQEYYKKLSNFDNLKRYMPVFLSNE